MGQNDKKRRIEYASGSNDGQRFRRVFSYIRQDNLTGLETYLGIAKMAKEDLKDLFVRVAPSVFLTCFSQEGSLLRQYIINHQAIRVAMKDYYAEHVNELHAALFKMASYYQHPISSVYYVDAVKDARIAYIAFLLQLEADVFHEHWNNCQGKDCMNDLLKEEYNAALEQCGMSPLSSAAGSVTP